MDSQIIKLVGTTKPTIKAVRERSHWNITNIVPTDPVLLGLCKQLELDSAISKLEKKSNIEVDHNSKNKKTDFLNSINSDLALIDLDKKDTNDLNKEDILKNAESLFEQKEKK